MSEEGTSTGGVIAGPTPEMVACIQKVVEETVSGGSTEGSSVGSGEGSSKNSAAGSTRA